MKKQAAPYESRITCDSTVMVGKPVVRGTRIPVETVLGRLADNPDLSDLFAAYPRLSIDDVKACLAFAQAQVRKARRPKSQTRFAEPHAPSQ
jgi:uncharacterized protein (DUF433 family)